MAKALLFVSSFVLGACASASGEATDQAAEDLSHATVKAFVTSHPSHPFEAAPQASFGSPAPEPGSAGTIAITDDAAHQKQEVDGFGAALTDAAAAVMWNELDANERSQLLDELMSETRGIGLSMLRLPIAASDSTTHGAYSYDDGPPDPRLLHFSIKHDEAYILPILKDILDHKNAKVRIIATPWSPPAWMKKGTSSMIGGELRDEYRGAYAQYFVHFVRAYWENHVPIFAVTPQNEPGQPANYPSMTMPPDAERTFVVENLAPALDRAHFGWVKILGFDHNWGDAYPDRLLAFPDARKALDGLAFHCYGGDHSSALTALHDRFPDKPIYMTECDRSQTPSGEEAGHHGEGIQKLIRAMRNWSRTYMAWQLVLHPDGTPNQGSGCMKHDASGNVVWHCVGVVSVKDHHVTKEWDYAYLGHASKFVARGARVVESNTVGPIENVAFVNPNGGRVLVAYNASTSEQRFQVAWHGSSFNARIPARSAATFTW